MSLPATRERNTPDDPTPVGGSRPVLEAVRRSGGRVTVGDVVAATGLAHAAAEADLRRLLENRRGHLEVGEGGEVVYRFDPRLVGRDAEPLLERLKRRAWSVFQKAFKVWIAVMLVVYFVVFVVLLVAAVVASQSRDEGGGGWGGGNRRGHGHGHGHFPSFWFWYVFWTPDWRWGRPYYGHRWEQKMGGRVKVPFYKKVFAFVFGPDEPRPSQEQRDRSIIRLIRARGGVLTVAELVQHTGLPREEAEEEMARLMAAHQGDVRVAGDGEIAWIFPSLMVTAEGRVREREPDPAWRRLEPEAPLTGNDTGANLLVAGLNAFNLGAAATAPLFIFPRLGLGGDLAWAFLVWVPMAFSTLFFAVPVMRWWSVRRENVRRRARNLRKALLGFVYRATLVGDGAQPVRADELTRQVKGVLPGEAADPVTVDEALVRLVAEFDGEVEAGPGGATTYRFPEILRQFRAGEALRRRLALEEKEVGAIVYSSADTVEEAGERELATFDRDLELQRELERYVQAPDRVDYLDEFELVAFDEEARRRLPEGSGRR